MNIQDLCQSVSSVTPVGNPDPATAEVGPASRFSQTSLGTSTRRETDLMFPRQLGGFAPPLQASPGLRAATIFEEHAAGPQTYQDALKMCILKTPRQHTQRLVLPAHLQRLLQPLAPSAYSMRVDYWKDLWALMHNTPLCAKFELIAREQGNYIKLWKRSLQCQYAAICFIREQKGYFFRAQNGELLESWQNVLMLNEMDNHLFTQQKAIPELFKAIRFVNFTPEQIEPFIPDRCDPPCSTHTALFDAQAWLQAEGITIIIPFTACSGAQQYQFRLNENTDPTISFPMRSSFITRVTSHSRVTEEEQAEQAAQRTQPHSQVYEMFNALDTSYRVYRPNKARRRLPMRQPDGLGRPQRKLAPAGAPSTQQLQLTGAGDSVA